MKTLYISLFLTLFFAGKMNAQYFPPVVGNDWDTISLSELNWCQDQLPVLYDYLETSNTKAFIVLKDGKIAIEKYFGSFTQDSLWYWASAGKTLTAFLVGKSQEEGLLNITDTTSNYLGTGWTNLTTTQEEKITIRHQLSMTTGLDDGVADQTCTNSNCLIYKALAGTRWAYHNAPYTLLQNVVEAASGTNFNTYLNPRLKLPTGMDGFFIPVGYNSVYFSKPRSMARFGLLMLNNGNWDGVQLMTDMTYFNEMITPSQTINNSYGYLWWLNGQTSFMLPSLQTVFPNHIIPNAPSDVYAAIGKNGQILNVSPNHNIVMIRMGDNPDNSLVPNLYNDTIWQKLNHVICTTSSVKAFKQNDHIELFPNPARDYIHIKREKGLAEITIYNTQGQVVLATFLKPNQEIITLPNLSPSLYHISIRTEQEQVVKQLLIY